MATTTLLVLMQNVAKNLDVYENTNYLGGESNEMEIREAINRALGKLKYQTIVPLTLVTDGDMETSGVTNWTATTATVTKNSTGLNSVLYGTQSLRVLNTSASGKVQSATIPCVPSTSYYLQARVRAVVGTATLIAYDVTNSANIDSDTWANSGWGVINVNFTVPATCENIAIRMQGTGTVDDIYWDSVILLRDGARDIPLPSYITSPGQVIAVLQDIQRDNFDLDHLVPIEDVTYRPDMSNPNWSYWLHLPRTAGGLLWLEVNRPFPSALSATTDTTFCDEQLASIGGTVELLERLTRRFPGDSGIVLRQDYARFVKKLKQRQRELRPPMQLTPVWKGGVDVPYYSQTK